MPGLSVAFWIGIAIVFFWAVGAYNRLVRLRASVIKGFAALDEQLLRQLVWVQGCLPEAMRGGPQTLPAELHTDETAAWARLQAAADQFALALAQARSKPIDGPLMASLVMSHEAMRTAWAGALGEAVPEGAVPSAERLQQRWMRLLHQSIPLRTAYNEAAATYNAAIGQFPASVIARLFGFAPAGTLIRLADTR